MKLLRLLLGEKGQITFDARRLSEASTLEDALRQLTNFWSPDDNIFAAYIHPLYDSDEDLLYRKYIKDLWLKPSAGTQAPFLPAL